MTATYCQKRKEAIFKCSDILISKPFTLFHRIDIYFSICGEAVHEILSYMQLQPIINWTIRWWAGLF